MIPLEQALSAILAASLPLRPETVPLEAAHGRVLAAPLTAAHNQPPFDASAMDGYAVRAADVVPGWPLRLAGTAQAGQRFTGMMQPGQCVRIFTGAPMPIGADAVIMQEQAQADGAMIAFAAVPAPGQNVRRRGNDFADGQALLAAGAVLTPAALGLAAAANRTSLSVHRRPAVALLSTGDELVPPGRTPGPDQIIASNGYALRPLLSPYASGILDLGIVPDNRALLDAAVLRALDANADVIVSTGGASIGERDYMREVLIDLGVELDFWTLAIRPGKPLMFGRRGRTLVFGLPGNPVSAFVTAVVLLLPALRALCGNPAPNNRSLILPLTDALQPNGVRRHFLRGRLVTGDAGVLGVSPISETDSAHMSSLAGADALIEQPENDPGQPPGTLVRVIPFGWLLTCN